MNVRQARREGRGNLHRYWAKAHRGGPEYHLLAYHLLDVGACATRLLERNPPLQESVGKLLGMPPAAASRAFAWLVALHDIGKLHPSFQGLRPDLARELGAPAGGVYDPRHDALGLCAFQTGLTDELAAWMSDEATTQQRWRDALDVLAPLLAGHHGEPAKSGGQRWHARTVWPPSLRVEAKDVAFALAEAMEVDRAAMAKARPDADGLAFASWELAGFVVLADWLGSNERTFPFRSDAQPLAGYWTETLSRADVAVADSGVLPIPPSASTDLIDVLGAGRTPTPLQRAVLDLKLEAGPTLVILEDQTGAGKTEAALLLARRMLQAGGGDGLYFALPTGATSDAMYARLRPLYGSLFEAATQPNLRLTHSRAPAAQDDNAPTATQWLLEHRKRALLAHVGVGTIDQALMAVLPVRHQALRLLALSGRVLIVDEVHAYDDYMITLLKRLLRHHLRRGGNVILLSATLPAALVDTLATTVAPRPAAEPAAYPRMTVASPHGARSVAFASSDSLRKTIRVQFHERPEDVLAILLAAREAGKACAWIRNTVTDTLDAARAIRDDKLILHSRFIGDDRGAKERELLAWAGPTGDAEARRGRLVVSTQVIEHSLDVDFDVLVTDLAPMDLLIQRAGRLHRHARGDRGRPVLHVLAPPWQDEPTHGWYARAFPRAAAVYPNEAHLWQTHKALRDAGAITIPDDVRSLVEAVYGSHATPPPGLKRSAMLADAEDGARFSAAELRALDLSRGYADNGWKWDDDTAAKTRYGTGTADLWLADADNGGPIARSWDGARVPAPLRWLDGVEHADPRAIPWRPPRLLHMRRDGTGWVTDPSTLHRTNRRIRYDAKLGLREEEDS